MEQQQSAAYQKYLETKERKKQQRQQVEATLKSRNSGNSSSRKQTDASLLNRQQYLASPYPSDPQTNVELSRKQSAFVRNTSRRNNGNLLKQYIELKSEMLGMIEQLENYTKQIRIQDSKIKQIDNTLINFIQKMDTKIQDHDKKLDNIFNDISDTTTNLMELKEKSFKNPSINRGFNISKPPSGNSFNEFDTKPRSGKYGTSDPFGTSQFGSNPSGVALTASKKPTPVNPRVAIPVSSKKGTNFGLVAQQVASTQSVVKQLTPPKENKKKALKKQLENKIEQRISETNKKKKDY
jgi:hypothetical protein